MRKKLRIRSRRTSKGYSFYVRGATNYHFFKKYGIKKFL